MQRAAAFFAPAIHIRAPREIQLREIDPVVGRRTLKRRGIQFIHGVQIEIGSAIDQQLGHLQIVEV